MFKKVPGYSQCLKYYKNTSKPTTFPLLHLPLGHTVSFKDFQVEACESWYLHSVETAKSWWPQKMNRMAHLWPLCLQKFQWAINHHFFHIKTHSFFIDNKDCPLWYSKERFLYLVRCLASTTGQSSSWVLSPSPQSNQWTLLWSQCLGEPWYQHQTFLIQGQICKKA